MRDANVPAAEGTGTDTKAGDQALSAGANAARGGDLTNNYDRGGAPYAGSLKIPTDHSINASTFTDQEKNASGMPEALKRLGNLQAKRAQMEARLKEETDERNHEKDPDKFRQLDAKVEQDEKAYQHNLHEIYKEEKVVKKIKRHVDAEGPPTAPLVGAKN